MAHLEGFLPTGHRYCSVRPALDKFSYSSIVPTINPTCRSSFVVYPAWIAEPLTPQRCQWISHCLHSPSLAWERLGCIDSNVPVLVRREQDGFYYRGTVKEEIESERGMFLVEFAKPLASRGKHPVCVQKTAKDDILEYVNGMKHSLLPGDKVLAPWEPDMARYGPGTILTGIETRDPLRASEDEEIIVHFWNDKKVKLPRNVALWIPPGLWERIVEMIHMPFTSRVKPRESPDANSCIFPCSPKLALIPVCAGHSLAKHCLLCSPRWPRFHCHCGGGMCCLSVCVRCTCCCHPRAGAWWPLPSRSLAFQNKSEEAESSSEPSPCLLEVEGTNQEAAAAVATSSSSSDSGWDLKSFPTRSTVVDSGVNTSCSCLEKPKLKDSARPQWRYWKRSHHMSQSSNPGLGSCSSTCTNGKLESKAVSTGDTSRVAPVNRSAMFETTELSPRGQLTVKEILRDQDFKPSLGPLVILNPEDTLLLFEIAEAVLSCDTDGIRSDLQQTSEARKAAVNKDTDAFFSLDFQGICFLSSMKKVLQHQKNEETKERQMINVKRLAWEMTNLMLQTMSELACNKAETNTINKNSVHVQLMEFRG